MANTATQTQLYLIEDSTLAAMAANANFTKEFPFLKGLNAVTRQKAGCGKCGVKNVQKTSTFHAARQAIAHMGDAQKRKLKALLNTKQIRLVYTRSDRQTIKLTF